jgi:hypothetical protein
MPVTEWIRRGFPKGRDIILRPLGGFALRGRGGLSASRYALITLNPTWWNLPEQLRQRADFVNVRSKEVGAMDLRRELTASSPGYNARTAKGVDAHRNSNWRTHQKLSTYQAVDLRWAMRGLFITADGVVPSFGT